MAQVEPLIAIMCGGSGTRLWPLSRDSWPKPFLDFDKNVTLFGHTCERVRSIATRHPLLVVTNKAHAHLVQDICDREKYPVTLLKEPIAKNTMTAVSYAVFWAWKQDLDPKTPLAFVPADHWVPEPENFAITLRKAIDAAIRYDTLVTLGINPVSPHTGYGYIELGPIIEPESELYQVAKFHEKPDSDTAASYVQKGFLWNAGIFVATLEKWKNLIQQYAPSWYHLFFETHEPIESIYEKATNLSVDFALIEKLSFPNLATIRGKFAWNDVGQFESLAEIFYQKAKNAHFYDSFGCHVFSLNPEKSYHFVGCKDIIVADTGDATLVLQKGHGSEVSNIVKLLKEIQPHLTRTHTFEFRPWGAFFNLLEGPNFKVKLIEVKPGHCLSYQSHNFRQEHWVVISGEGSVRLENETKHIHPGDHIHIPIGAKHQLCNTHNSELLKIIEVQLGQKVIEEDIIRYQDPYNR